MCYKNKLFSKGVALNQGSTDLQGVCEASSGGK
jgi:hypothetical protein